MIRGQGEAGEQPPSFEFDHQVKSDTSGYLQGIDETELMSFARSNNAVVRLLRRPGDFIREDETIAEVTRVTQ